MQGLVKSAVLVAVGILGIGHVSPASAEEAAAADGNKAEKNQSAEAPEKLVPLNKKETVLLDRQGKRVLLKAEVVLREGLLEMLCCLKHTKEHESILAVDAKAYVIHTGLLAIGAEPGTPVKFSPEFEPPTGQRIDVYLQWRDEKGKLHREKGQHWIRHATRRFYSAEMKELPADVQIPDDSPLGYDEDNQELSWYGPMTDEQRDELLKLSDDKEFQKAIKSFYKKTRPQEMEADWIFPGSGFYVDEKTGEKTYQAEGGDVICVANFPTAMLDVEIRSSASGKENLLYEAYTERIPPLETEVTVELIPVFEEEKEKKKP